MPEDYLEIVANLNMSLAIDSPEMPNSCFMFTSNGFSHVVTFDDFIIWNSAEENRKFDETTNCYIPGLETHIKQEFNKWVDSLSILKFNT